MLGHASPVTTQRYIQGDTAGDQLLAELMDD